MPELPEVEHARRTLERAWTGRTITQVDALDPAVVRTHLSTLPSDALPEGASWLGRWVGARVGPFLRRGKRFGWTCDGVGVRCHLGMTGRWIHRSAPSVKHARLRVRLDDGSDWWFEDPRRFGCVAPVDGDLIEVLEAGLGPDALIALPSPETLGTVLGTGRATIKSRLMDQTRIAGIGNIQATEALWHARIHPATRADRVESWAPLREGIAWTLARTLEDAGQDELVYLSRDPSRNPFLVYGRVGEGCTRCGSELQATRLSGRVSPYCPTCQPAT